MSIIKKTLEQITPIKASLLLKNIAYGCNSKTSPSSTVLLYSNFWLLLKGRLYVISFGSREVPELLILFIFFFRKENLYS